MKKITDEIVEMTWKRIGGMSASQIPELIQQMQRQQPVILVYLMASGGDTLNGEERELLLYLGVVVWQIMLQGDIQPPQVSEETLAEAETSNTKMLEYLGGESESNFIETTKVILNNYAQPEVLRYVTEVLMEDDEDLVREDNKGMICIFLKTVIDCLNGGNGVL